MDAKEIIAAYGAYYENSGQNTKRILRLLAQGAETPKFMTPVMTNDTIYRLAQATIKKIVQPYRKGWHPKDAVAFKPNELKLYKMKVDEDVEPDEIEATWLGFLASHSINRKDWPFVKYIIETLYIPQIHQDMELDAYFWGVRKDEAEEGKGLEPRDSMDGIHKQLQTGVDQETINLVSGIGELKAETAFDQVEAFDDGITGVYENVPMCIFVSPAMKKAYLRDKRAQGFYDMKSDADINSDVDFSPRKVIGLPSMTGYKYMFATPQANFLHLTKKSANKTNIKLEESKRIVSLLCDWWEGVGFGIDGAVWTTQPKTVTPPAEGGA